MIIYPPTYGMRCRTCGTIVPVGTPIGIDDAGADFVEHPECFARRTAKAALDECMPRLLAALRVIAQEKK